MNGLLLACVAGWTASSLRAEDDPPTEGKKPYSRSVELTDAAIAKIMEKYPGAEIVSQKSYWFGNAGSAGNGTLGGSRRWEVVVKTKREEPVPDGQPKPAKPKEISETHTLVVKKDGFVVSQTDPLDITKLPAEVKEAALSQTGGTEVKSADQIISALSTRYKVKTNKGEVLLNSDGTVVPAKYAAPQEPAEGE